MHWFNVAWHWVEIKTGVQPLVPNPLYNFWSGFGSDIGEVAIVGGLVTLVRHHNCHARGCFRLGKHEYEMDGVRYKLCRTHHPAVTGKPTVADIESHHARNSK